MRVGIDRNKCRRCGLCVAICPEIFEVGRDHIARVKHFEVPPVGDLQRYCVYAFLDCPAGAIDLVPMPACELVLEALDELSGETQYLSILP